MVLTSNRFDAIWSGEDGAALFPPSPDTAAGESLTAWYTERVARLGKEPTRERLWGLQILLQRRYFYEYHKALVGQHAALHAAYLIAYVKTETLLEDTDPPLPESVPITKKRKRDVEVLLMEDEP